MWAAKMTEYLCNMVDLPHAVVEEEDKLGVVCAEAPSVERLLHGKSDGCHGMASSDQLSVGRWNTCFNVNVILLWS